MELTSGVSYKYWYLHKNIQWNLHPNLLQQQQPPQHPDLRSGHWCKIKNRYEPFCSMQQPNKMMKHQHQQRSVSEDGSTNDNNDPKVNTTDENDNHDENDNNHQQDDNKNDNVVAAWMRMIRNVNSLAVLTPLSLHILFQEDCINLDFQIGKNWLGQEQNSQN
jgi:hypothetical protein